MYWIKMKILNLFSLKLCLLMMPQCLIHVPAWLNGSTSPDGQDSKWTTCFSVCHFIGIIHTELCRWPLLRQASVVTVSVLWGQLCLYSSDFDVPRSLICCAMKSKNITIDNSLRQKVNVISRKGLADKQSYQGIISQILFGVSIKFLFDSLESAVLKVFQKLLNTNTIFLLHFGVYFALLWKPDFLNEPELLIKRTWEGN